MGHKTYMLKRKNIDIREDVYRFLSIKAAASGTNLKSYYWCPLKLSDKSKK